MKLLAALCLAGSFFALPPQAPAQAGTVLPNSWTKADPKGFCRTDRRPEISNYCQNLADLQTRVNEERTSTGADLSSSNDNFTDPLNKLNLTDRRSLYNFISATAVKFATNQAIANALRDAGQQRPDQQLSPGNSASGTTTLVSKIGSAELLSLAIDSGILTRSVNGTTANLSTNLDQLFRLVTGSDPDCIVTTDKCQNRGWIESNVLTRTTISAGMDLAQRSSETTVTSGQASGPIPTPVDQAAIPTGAGKLSNITARYQVRNGFDPRGEKFKTAWQGQLTSAFRSQVTLIGDETDAVWNALSAHKSFSGADSDRARTNLVQAAADDPTGHKLVNAFEDDWNEVVTSDLARDPTLAAAVSRTVQDRAMYREAWFRALDQAAGTMLTFEYNFNRPVNQPQTHDFKIIYGYDFGTMGMLTFNGGMSLYDSIPTAAKYGRLHYGQASLEYDRTTSGKGKALQTQLSLAGYWQYQPEPSILNIPEGTVAPGTNIPLPNGTQEFIGTAGSLWVTQAKLTIKAAGGINIPIGVSWSNKTDLLQGSKVGAQIGISYNFASLAGLFSSPGSQ